MNLPSTGELWRELLERRERNNRRARFAYCILAGSILPVLFIIATNQ